MAHRHRPSSEQIAAELQDILEHVAASGWPSAAIGGRARARALVDDAHARIMTLMERYAAQHRTPD